MGARPARLGMAHFRANIVNPRTIWLQVINPAVVTRYSRAVAMLPKPWDDSEAIPAHKDVYQERMIRMAEHHEVQDPEKMPKFEVT